MSDQPIIDTPESWDAASQGYAEKVAPFLMETFAEEFIERLDVNDNTEALEVAAGSGALTAALAKRVKSLLATDFSPKMIEQVKLKINNAGLTNVSFALMDGQALEVDDATMDRVACSFALMLFPDRHQGFKEMKRVLRPGGKAVVSGWAGPDKFEVFGLFLAAIQQAFPDFPKPDSPPPVFSLADLGSFKAQMEAAGFQNVEVEYVAKSLTVNSFDEMWAMLTIGAPPVKMLFDKVGADGKDRVHDALAEIVEKRFGNGPITITNTATVGTGTV
jgi:ubiquinone/menaquinone biosynthesis C-methylase UbiE